MSDYNVFEDLADSVLKGCKVIKTLDEGDAGDRYIAYANSFKYNAQSLRSLIKRYLLDQSEIDDIDLGDIQVDVAEKTVGEIYVLTAFAACDYSYFILTVTDSSDLSYAVDEPVLVDLRTSSM